ncbi:MAG: hypothetical protein OXB92_06385 [Acidimicrobiaceae bacterium]|nr:hypothetical protein [Acidimicrobiia bacterium]MCY4493465.1 hypothetical protein [Acidimicrobiaceae bacterium]
MRGSVLKNRLLDLTNRRFDEADYGADRFGTLVERLDGLLVIDHSAKPFIVELCDPYRSEIDSAEQAHQSRSKGTIRSDLWNAIMDYSGVGEWVWDRSLGMAVPADERSTGMREIFFQRWTDLPSRLGEPDSSKSTRRDCKVKKHLSLKTGRVRASVLRRFRCASADSGTRECGNKFGSGYSSSSKHTNWNRRWMRSFQSGHENRPMSFGHSFCGALQS